MHSNTQIFRNYFIYIYVYIYMNLYIYTYTYIHVCISTHIDLYKLELFRFDTSCPHSISVPCNFTAEKEINSHKNIWSFQETLHIIFGLHVNISSILELTRVFLTNLTWSMPCSKQPMIRIYRPILRFREAISQWYRHTPQIPLWSLCQLYDDSKRFLKQAGKSEPSENSSAEHFPS